MSLEVMRAGHQPSLAIGHLPFARLCAGVSSLGPSALVTITLLLSKPTARLTAPPRPRSAPLGSKQCPVASFSLNRPVPSHRNMAGRRSTSSVPSRVESSSLSRAVLWRRCRDPGLQMRRLRLQRRSHMQQKWDHF